ncbi:hypothetical protein [Streptomyces echinatus]|uniref:hypothetical protein n=1 Tax=Streptomyces echinatus TaxID=67293 RepID=UPI0031EBE633
MDDPAVLAAVAGVLADPDGLRPGLVHQPAATTGSRPAGPGHAFSAAVARQSLRGEDTVA